MLSVLYCIHFSVAELLAGIHFRRSSPERRWAMQIYAYYVMPSRKMLVVLVLTSYSPQRLSSCILKIEIFYNNNLVKCPEWAILSDKRRLLWQFCRLMDTPADSRPAIPAEYPVAKNAAHLLAENAALAVTVNTRPKRVSSVLRYTPLEVLWCMIPSLAKSDRIWPTYSSSNSEKLLLKNRVPFSAIWIRDLMMFMILFSFAIREFLLGNFCKKTDNFTNEQIVL